MRKGIRKETLVEKVRMKYDGFSLAQLKTLHDRHKLLRAKRVQIEPESKITAGEYEPVMLEIIGAILDEKASGKTISKACGSVDMLIEKCMRELLTNEKAVANFWMAIHESGRHGRIAKARLNEFIEYHQEFFIEYCEDGDNDPDYFYSALKENIDNFLSEKEKARQLASNDDIIQKILSKFESERDFVRFCHEWGESRKAVKLQGMVNQYVSQHPEYLNWLNEQK